MRTGVFEVVPRSLLDGTGWSGANVQLTAEDLRLLLCGVPELDVGTLERYTSWHDESGLPASLSATRLANLKIWFWQLVARLNREQQHDLVSPSPLPLFRASSLYHITTS